MARGSDEHYSNLFRNEKRRKNERLFLFIPVVSISRFRNTVTVSVLCTHTHTTTSRPNKRPAIGLANSVLSSSKLSKVKYIAVALQQSTSNNSNNNKQCQTE